MRIKKKVLIVVRTYPSPATKGVEVSCTAGITEDGEWVRLFPIPYRFLDPDKRFKKYQWIEAVITKAGDARPESYKIDIDTIRILTGEVSTNDGWAARKEILGPHITSSMCHLRRVQEANGHPTLGLFKPKTIDRFIIEPSAATWTPTQLAILQQLNLFEEKRPKELEKVPFKFIYQFHCDEAECKGHRMMCADWEMGESWRRWRDKYGDGWEEKFRLKYESEMMNRFDTHFYVGTVHQHPREWIIIGLFYPPPSPPPQPHTLAFDF